MKGEPTIAITLACAYCSSKLIFSQSAITVQSKRGELTREGKIAELRCPQCESTFEVSLVTKRKRQGPGYKRIVAKARELYNARVAYRRERNAMIGAALLAQRGCTCGERIERDAVAGIAAGRDDGGHPLVSSWSREYEDGRDLGMLPQQPRHFHGCPLRGSADEAALLGRLGDVADDVGRDEHEHAKGA